MISISLEMSYNWTALVILKKSDALQTIKLDQTIITAWIYNIPVWRLQGFSPQLQITALH